MRLCCKEFVEITLKHLSLKEPIFNFGSFETEGQDKWSSLEEFFPDKQYVGVDSRSGPGVDMVLDLHKLDLYQSVGTALCVDTLEHVERPWEAIKEIHRVLKSDGIFIGLVPFYFPIHYEPNDYWRFTQDALVSLCKDFLEVHVGECGQQNRPHTSFAIASKSKLNPTIVGQLMVDISHWQNKWARGDGKILEINGQVINSDRQLMDMLLNQIDSQREKECEDMEGINCP